MKRTSANSPFAVLGLLVTIFAGASLLAAAPTLEEVARFHEEKGRADALWLLKQDLAEPESAMAALMERRKSSFNYSLMQDGMQLCRDTAIYGRAQKDPRIVQAAAAFADALLHKHVTPSGGFVEYDRNTWLEPSEMWRTIPWGTAFCGNRAFEAWVTIKNELTPEQRAFWRKSFENNARWIYKNPVLGGYVFNCAIDLCGLLWRIGHEFEHPEWCQWALEAAEHRIRRDVDDEGWIQGENGGASGAYQLIGARYLSTLAWESKAPALEEAVRRIFAKSSLPYATPTLEWTGNFGTRISGLRQLPGMLVLVAAALGDPAAAYFVKTRSDPNWSDDLGLWRAALANHGQAPVYPAVVSFRGISGTVVREGPWIAYFGNYDRSIWARGFASLWHGGRGDWLFSTLHSLPASTLSATERAKARLGDTNDWAGFPHVHVSAGPARYDSQQRIDSIQATAVSDGVTVTWTEPLLDDDGNVGGQMHSTFRFHGPEIESAIDLRNLAGASTLDFHFMKRADGWANFWSGEQMTDILAGRFVQDAGYGSFTDRTLKPGEQRLLGVQLDRTIFSFEVIEAPASASFKLVGNTESGLHTGDLGGFRIRIEVPAQETSYVLKLKLRALE